MPRIAVEVAGAMCIQPTLGILIVFMVAYQARSALAVAVAVTVALCTVIASALMPFVNGLGLGRLCTSCREHSCWAASRNKLPGVIPAAGNFGKCFVHLGSGRC